MKCTFLILSESFFLFFTMSRFLNFCFSELRPNNNLYLSYFNDCSCHFRQNRISAEMQAGHHLSQFCFFKCRFFLRNCFMWRYNFICFEINTVRHFRQLLFVLVSFFCGLSRSSLLGGVDIKHAYFYFTTSFTYFFRFAQFYCTKYVQILYYRVHTCYFHRICILVEMEVISQFPISAMYFECSCGFFCFLFGFRGGVRVAHF